MDIPNTILADLNWWESNLQSGVKYIKLGCFKEILYIDPSQSGWGAKIGERETSGFWDRAKTKLLINYLEL